MIYYLLKFHQLIYKKNKKMQSMGGGNLVESGDAPARLPPIPYKTLITKNTLFPLVILLFSLYTLSILIKTTFHKIIFLLY